MKLSKTQIKVLSLMRDGWEMGASDGLYFTIWLQKNGVGRGGPTEKVNGRTFISLEERKLIKTSKNGYPTKKYVIADAGIEALNVNS